MGWTGAYPTLCRKRPTASLVSRKVLTPLLGQVVICIIIQFIGFEIVKQQTWYAIVFDPRCKHDLYCFRYIPPKLNKQKSNVKNSQNTTLFLISCFQYILSGIVLSIGPPFRQSMTQNRRSKIATKIYMVADSIQVPFVVTIVATLLFSIYMLMDPGAGLSGFMKLTTISLDFKGFILVLALVGFLCAWTAERYAFPWCASIIGRIHVWIWPDRRKKRKEYKLLSEKMRI